MKGKINELPNIDTSKYNIDESGNVLRDKRMKKIEHIAIRTYDTSFLTPSGMKELNEFLTNGYIVFCVTRGNDYNEYILQKDVEE
jgi:hypothetical protein